jgi:hypothetical protein
MCNLLVNYEQLLVYYKQTLKVFGTTDEYHVIVSTQLLCGVYIDPHSVVCRCARAVRCQCTQCTKASFGLIPKVMLASLMCEPRMNIPSCEVRLFPCDIWQVFHRMHQRTAVWTLINTGNTDVRTCVRSVLQAVSGELTSAESTYL